MAPIRKSEEEVGRIWDRCFVDTAIKSATGALVGSIFSLIFFKRKAWPITLGLGVGIGAGYTNCRHQFWWRRHYPHPQLDSKGYKYRPAGMPFWRHSKKDKSPEKKEDIFKPVEVTAETKPSTPEDKPAES